MASSFDRWEKDPFFSAAEEVQESADRMQSTYRTWIHAKKDSSDSWNLDELQRDLRTALGTTKWQLEEFERAVRSSYINSSSDDARDRHHDFIVAIDDQISEVNNSLRESTPSNGRTTSSWVRLDEGERNELALFLSGPSAFNIASDVPNRARDNEDHKEMEKESTPDRLKNSCQSTEWSSMDTKDEKSFGHRRTASASADVGFWKIAIAGDGYQQNSLTGHSALPPRKIPSVSGFLNSLDSVSGKFKWPKNGFRKWKVTDSHHEADSALLRSSQLDKGIHACYERSKSCLDTCEDCYDKQLYGWYGALQRQLQRSQYQMQYSRPVQLALSAILLLCLIVLIAIRTF